MKGTAKGTEAFKQTIKEYLGNRAATDPLFAETYAKPKKNIDDCVNYILSTVQKSGCNGFAREEIFSMAVHYYDEDDIKVGTLPANLRVVINKAVELSDEEKEKARQAALKKAEEEAYKKITQRTPKKKAEPTEQPSLFD